MTKIPVTKMAGAGNDFLIMDVRRHALASLRRRWAAVSRALCDRHRGIGADGLLVLERSRAASARMRVFNPDGSEAEMCGNGARCVARYLQEGRRGSRRANAPTRVTIETKAGLIGASVRGDRVAMHMTEPTELTLDLTLKAGGDSFSLGVVNTGVPHAVVPVKAIETVDVERLGRALRQHPHFSPRGTNVNFVQEAANGSPRLLIRTYERGVEAETLACGTGVAAAAVLFALRDQPDERGGRRDRGSRASRQTIDVQTRSGDVLNVSFIIEGQGRQRRATQVVLEGTASRIFDGVAYWSAQSEES